MKFIVDWVSNIVVFILFATVLTMLLPSSSMGKYVKLAVSLLLITLIINPLFQLFHTDITQVISSFNPQTFIANGKIENQLNLTKNEIQATQRAYILEQMAVQLKRQVENDVLSQYGEDIITVSVVPKENVNTVQSPDDLQEVLVTVKTRNPSSTQTVETVQKVVIDTTNPYEKPNDEVVAKNEQIVQLLAQKWGIAQEKIKVSTEGGTNGS